jgi:cellulose synthase/poly-beta-1,6-N-acetylglucosamine synthase-like glycosyltransferase
MIASVLATIFVVCAALICLFVSSLLFLVWLHARLKPAGLARERELLERPLPADAELPHVVVQIPSFNEGAVLRRGAEAAAALDWPRDKLHIQLLDDSTDDTAELARTVAREISARGIDIVAIQRTDRSGFKGGALAEGMQKTPHKYFAVFDVDYVPEPDFLRRCMRAMLTPGKTAFVQARFDFLNPHQNALTEMQMVTLDGHLGIEQATRSWAGHPLPFNGTCGIWNRDAIDAGGGWKGDTVTEDLDLTYRTWLAGWRGIFLTSIAVPGELPADTRTFVRQQQRWVDGFGHVSLRMAPAILAHSGLTLSARLAAVLHLCMALNRPLLLLGVVCMIVAIVLAPTMAPCLLAIFFAAIVFAIATQATMLWAGHRFLRGDKALPAGQFASLIGRAVRWQIRQLFYGLGVFLKQLVRPKPIEFDRTPKQG